MNGKGKEEEIAFEMGVVVPKRSEEEAEQSFDCIEVLVDEFRKAGLIVERVVGVQNEYIKLAAPLEILARASAELKMKKRTHIGVDLQFHLDEVDAFVRQPDGSLFRWCERFRCYCHIMYKVVNQSSSTIVLKFNCRDLDWKQGESLVEKLKSEAIIKDVFPLHVERRRKLLLRTWAFHWWDFTAQPIEEIYSYYGTKIATYFTFLGMYTRWMLFPAAVGLIVQLVDFGSIELLVLPLYFISLITWAVLFLQFWKRKSSALMVRWQADYASGRDREYKFDETLGPGEVMRKQEVKKVYQREEWSARYTRFRNDIVVITSIICLQLPFELAYAHLYEVLVSDLLRFFLTAVYLLIIQYLTKLGGKISVSLVKHEKNNNVEYRADSLVYKVFGLYFMQSYIGLFYHALLHRNVLTLRQVLVQRLILSEVVENLIENGLPYFKYSLKKYRAFHKRKREQGARKMQSLLRIEKEFLKPAYSASIGAELEDGLFDDFLELALQFGMIMMFACAFPVAFVFAMLNNLTEIRTDALKLLAMMRRPIPRADATIGAWLNIFQFLIVMSICTNSALLVCLYDQEGQWRIPPGLAGILIMEHILLIIKFGFSRIIPGEPAWVKASRLKNATQAQDMCSRQLLRSISGEMVHSELKKD